MQKKVLVLTSLLVLSTFLVSFASAEVSSTCQSAITNKCHGATNMIDCLKGWLVQSGCFSQSYVDEHFSDFKVNTKDENMRPVACVCGTAHIISFVFTLQDSSGANVSTSDERTYAYIGQGDHIDCSGLLTGSACYVGEQSDNRIFGIIGYVGPLKEYRQLNINKEDALQKAKADSFCNVPSESTSDSVTLSYDDEFGYNGKTWTIFYNNDWDNLLDIPSDTNLTSPNNGCRIGSCSVNSSGHIIEKGGCNYGTKGNGGSNQNNNQNSVSWLQKIINWFMHLFDR